MRNAVWLNSIWKMGENFCNATRHLSRKWSGKNYWSLGSDINGVAVKLNVIKFYGEIWFNCCELGYSVPASDASFELWPDDDFWEDFPTKIYYLSHSRKWFIRMVCGEWWNITANCIDVMFEFAFVLRVTSWLSREVDLSKWVPRFDLPLNHRVDRWANEIFRQRKSTRIPRLGRYNMVLMLVYQDYIWGLTQHCRKKTI